MASRKRIPPQEAAIQIIESTEEPDVSGKIKKIIRVVDKRENGPSLENILSANEVKDIPILVFSVIGRTRGGKSFLLNLMIKYLEYEGRSNWTQGRLEPVFEWRAGINSVTRGLWVCPKIFRRINSQGQEVGILLLDNQGLFDGEQTEGEAIAISAISTAVSHWQMFNLKEKITTFDLESIYRHLMKKPTNKVMNKNDDDADTNCNLLFIIRDFIAAEEVGCGLECGQQHIETERLRGTKEHQLLWAQLIDAFGRISCLPLPHPGIKVSKAGFTQSASISEIENDFISEVEKFFEWLFDPSNLLPANPTLTGRQLYDLLNKFNGQETDNSISFLNMWTEHGNQGKYEQLLARFKLYFSRSGADAARALMDDICSSANFKGKSAQEYLTKLKKEMGAQINPKVVEAILCTYKDLLVVTGNIADTHRKIWPSIKMKLLTDVCSETMEEREVAIHDFTMKAASIYYKWLQVQMSKRFQNMCRNAKTIKDVVGQDHQILEQFKVCRDFQMISCGEQAQALRAVWLRERAQLSEKLLDNLLTSIECKEKIDKSWLKEAIQHQYRVYEVMTWANPEVEECHWFKTNKKDIDGLRDFVNFALHLMNIKPVSSYPQDVIENIHNIMLKMYSESSFNIECSCSFVLYQSEKASISTPIFSVKKKGVSVLIDTQCRVYKDWDDFQKTNKLPACVYCFPIQGAYSKVRGFQVGFALSPAAEPVDKVLSTVGTVLGVGFTLASLGAGVALLPASATIGIGAFLGAFSLSQHASNIKDKLQHKEPITAKDILNVLLTVYNMYRVCGPIQQMATFEIGLPQMAPTQVATPQMAPTQMASYVCIKPYTLILHAHSDNLAMSVCNVDVMSKKFLFYCNDQSSEKAVKKIKEAFELNNNPSRIDIIKAFVKENCVECTVEEDNKTIVKQFVSKGIKKFVVDLLKYNDFETTHILPKLCSLSQYLMKEKETAGIKDIEKGIQNCCRYLKELFVKFKIDYSSVMSYLDEISHPEHTNILANAIHKANEEDKLLFGFVLRHFIYSVSGKIMKVNDTLANQGVQLRGYNNIEFFRLDDVLREINDSGISCLDVYDWLNINSTETPSLLMKKTVDNICNAANLSWNLQTFTAYLINLLEDILETFDIIVRNLESSTLISRCSKINTLIKSLKKVSSDNQVGLASCIFEELLESITASVDTQSYSGYRTILPAWQGLSDSLYCYCLSESQSDMSLREMIGIINPSVLLYQYEMGNPMENVKLLIPHNDSYPTYFIYQGFLRGQSCGLIYCHTV